MILDNEQQRNVLLNILAAAPINGSYKDVSDTVKILDVLQTDITNATIQSDQGPSKPV
jgi:hypothetical protein